MGKGSNRRFEAIEFLGISSAESGSSHCSQIPKKLQSKPQRKKELEKREIERERERENVSVCVYIYIYENCLRFGVVVTGEDIL